MTFTRRAWLYTSLPLLGSLGCGGRAGRAKSPGARAAIDASEYPSLQAAMDALPEQGGLVSIPAGHFKISEPLRITRGETTVQGAGAATHIENTNTAGEPAIVIEHPTIETPEMAESLWRIRLADLRLTGNPQSGHGVAARYILELFLQGLTVSRHGADGLHLDHCIEDARVSDSLVTYNGASGLFIEGGHDTIVSANQFEENHDAVRCVDGYNLTMTGNNIDDHLGHGVVLDNFYGSVLSGNMIEQSKGAGIVLERGSYGVTISANMIIHNQSGGIDLRSAHSCTISGNTLASNAPFGCRIASQAAHITIAGNTFSGPFTTPDGFDRAPDGGLALESPENVLVSGNVYMRPDKSAGVSGSRGRDVKLSENLSVR